MWASGPSSATAAAPETCSCRSESLRLAGPMCGLFNSTGTRTQTLRLPLSGVSLARPGWLLGQDACAEAHGPWGAFYLNGGPGRPVSTRSDLRLGVSLAGPLPVALAGPGSESRSSRAPSHAGLIMMVCPASGAQPAGASGGLGGPGSGSEPLALAFGSQVPLAPPAGRRASGHDPADSSDSPSLRSARRGPPGRRAGRRFISVRTTEMAPGRPYK